MFHKLKYTLFLKQIAFNFTGYQRMKTIGKILP